MIVTGPKGEQVVIKHLHKRDRTEVCELCERSRGRRLYYHHWDDDNPSLGIWVDFKCHRLVELVDQEGIYNTIRRMVKYVGFKSEVSLDASSKGSNVSV